MDRNAMIITHKHEKQSQSESGFDVFGESASRAIARQRRSIATPTRRASETSQKWGGVFLFLFFIFIFLTIF